MQQSLAHKIANEVGLEASDVERVIGEFCLQLHRGLIEYKGMNGDFLGEDLSLALSPQAFFHLLGFLDAFSERYDWEPGDASEYLARLGTRGHWAPFRHQCDGWKPGSV